MVACKSPDKDRNEFDLIIGKPGMKKLGLGIHPDRHVVTMRL